MKNWLRYIIQASVLILLVFTLLGFFSESKADPEAYCPFGGLQSLATFLVNDSLACSMTTIQIMMGAILALGVILFGKLFCSYLCPMGFISELFIRARRVLKINPIKIKSFSLLDRVLRIVKYVLLFWIFYMTLSSSELFCKNLDPYYAVATGFQGEITLWMSICTLSLLLLGSMFIDMFWCKYICPLGALSHIFKFTLWFIALILVYYLVDAFIVEIPWSYLLGASCLITYLLEIIVTRPKFNPHILAVHVDRTQCVNCNSCVKRCPYHISIPKYDRVSAIECNLCGECISSCKAEALSINKTSRVVGWIIPVVIIVILFSTALYLGSKVQIPTININWNNESVMPNSKLESLKMEGMRSIKCYGSSMGFKAKLENVAGVYGVKTYVGSGEAVIKYNPNEISADELRQEIFVPSRRIISDADSTLAGIKILTVRAEKMYDRFAPMFVGMHLKNSGKKFYGIETIYDCPLIVKLYVDESEEISEEFLKEIFEKETVTMKSRNGEDMVFPMGFEFVSLEKGHEVISYDEYIKIMDK